MKNNLFKHMAISSHTVLYALFGSPARHSLSPAMHNAAFRAAGIDAVYLAFEPDSIAGAVDALKSLGIRGASVTIPYKIDAVACLDEIDPLAAEIGSVNTLLNRDGKVAGYNTDGSGALRALAESGAGIDGASCLVIGNGGSARAIAFALLAGRSTVLIAGRSLSRAQSLASDLGGAAAGARAIRISEIDQVIIEGVDIIINTTPLGMEGGDTSLPIDPGFITPRHTVFDIVYVPRTTPLLAEASKRRAHVVHGIDMLVYQGALQFELWTGMDAPVREMFLAVNDALRTR